MTNSLLSIHPDIQVAIKEQQPIVALESTIISHGMPWPKNVETALEVEEVVRKNGAIPATIAIMNGNCYVGLSTDQISYLGKANNVWKVSIRDLPFVIANHHVGATTVAATMRIASMAGIKIFATGGIGGVHRGAPVTMDISADLTEMAVTNVAIVSAGVKSILDIGLTLEYLETLGVPVVTYGQDEFPSFYSSKSGFTSPLRIDDPLKIAEMLTAKWSLGLNGSVLIANPIPVSHEVPNDVIELTIQEALTEASNQNITGKNVTPFLLSFIAQHSKGESLNANIELIKNNAKLAAKIAVELK
jgi:pseudouridine-5'-phosphate glycosidase